MKLRDSFIRGYYTRSDGEMEPIGGVQIYDILSAIRGPDENHHPDTGIMTAVERENRKVAKEVYTSRIRTIAFEVGDDFPGIYKTSPLTRFELESVNYQKLDPHFRAHLGQAIDATVLHPIWGGLGTEAAGRMSP